MPIVDLQRRMTQLGEIRIGRAVDTGRVSEKTGRAIKRPEKLDRFRFTSPSKELLEQIAAAYGGQVERWSPQNGDPDEWEVLTTADRLPIIVPPNAISQWYELYQGSRCVRRCDGQLEQKTDQQCLCNPERRQCSLTTRLNVMLRDINGIGVWLLTTHGYYAAIELPPMAELLAHVGGYVDGFLTLEEKRVVREDGKTNRFLVPKLQVGITPAQLLAGSGSVAIGSGQRPAIGPAPTPALPAPLSDYLALARTAGSVEGVRDVWLQARDAGHLTEELAQELMEIGNQFAVPQQATPAAPQPEYDVDELWMRIVAACPDGCTTTQLEEDFAASNDGTFPGSASGAQLAAYLQGLKSRESVA